MTPVLQFKYVEDEPCIYFDDESCLDEDRREVRRCQGGLWQRGGYDSYMADDEWESLEGSESQRLEAEYQRLVKAGEVEDIDLLLERPRWIPVEERLPDEGSGGVLGFRRSDIAAGEHSYGMAWNHGGKLAWNEPMTPTHWMKLPEKPEVK